MNCDSELYFLQVCVKRSKASQRFGATPQRSTAVTKRNAPSRREGAVTFDTVRTCLVTHVLAHE